MQEFLIVTSSLFVLATKFADCWTTSRLMESITMETNPLARELMRRWGVGRVVWITFGVAVLVTIVTALPGLVFVSWWYTVPYVILALTVSAFQGAVSTANHTGRQNILTLLVFRWHGAMQRGLAICQRGSRR